MYVSDHRARSTQGLHYQVPGSRAHLGLVKEWHTEQDRIPNVYTTHTGPARPTGSRRGRQWFLSTDSRYYLFLSSP